jgi:3'-phosphoadenosine 5'-phosphosulfate sulfotransferase (PAPS reductase)/FAD synthetase
VDKSEHEAFLAYAHLPKFQRRVDEALGVIRDALAIAPAYCGVSWGKDSTVMLHLCQQVHPDIFAINIGDKLENLQDNYSEVVQLYCDAHQTNYQQILYDEHLDGGFFEQIERLYDFYPLAFIGCRAEENKRREIVINKYGKIHQYQSGANKGKWRAFPLAYWSWQDVWAYICLHDLPYLASYDHSLSEPRSKSRTAVIHNFDLHRGKHQEAIIRNGAFSRLKVIAPDYYRMYADLYPEVKEYG